MLFLLCVLFVVVVVFLGGGVGGVQCVLWVCVFHFMIEWWGWGEGWYKVEIHTCSENIPPT